MAECDDHPEREAVIVTDDGAARCGPCQIEAARNQPTENPARCPTDDGGCGSARLLYRTSATADNDVPRYLCKRCGHEFDEPERNQTLDEVELRADGGVIPDGVEDPDPEEYPSDETIYAFYGSVEAAGFSIVDEKGQPITADELRVNLYDHWGTLEDPDPEVRTDGGVDRARFQYASLMRQVSECGPDEQDRVVGFHGKYPESTIQKFIVDDEVVSAKYERLELFEFDERMSDEDLHEWFKENDPFESWCDEDGFYDPDEGLEPDSGRKVVTDGGVSISAAEFRKRKHARSVTPREERKRCPECGSTNIQRKTGKWGTGEQGKWYCKEADCLSRFDQPVTGGAP